MILADYRNKKIQITATVINYIGSILLFWILPKKIDRGKIKSVLIVKFDRIGDTFLATPSIEAIRNLFPHAKITALCAPWNKDVISNSPNIDCLEIYHHAPNPHSSCMRDSFLLRHICNLQKKIRQINPDILIDMQGSPLIVLSGFLAKVPTRIGFKRKLFSFLLNKRVPYLDGIHQSDVYFSIPKSLGYDTKPNFQLFVGDEVAKVKKILENNNLDNFLVFHLCAGRTYRQWPIGHFIDLASKLLLNKPQISIVIIGSKEDLSLCARFLEKLNDQIVNLVGQLTIKETFCLLSLSKGFVGNESGPAHLSASTGTPTVMLMNEWSGIERWQALGEKVYIIKSKNRHHCKGVACKAVPCPNMAAITVKEVFEVAKSFWNL